MIRTIEWKDSAIVILDQQLLPGLEVYRTYSDYREVAEAIRAMVIRGAPAIGVAAAMGVALGVKKAMASTMEELDPQFEEICSVFVSARPRR
jgi:methylthioribose-1-phosphate isomerase